MIHPQTTPSPNKDQSTDNVERLLKQAEIFRLTRSLKAKLAQASIKTNKSPSRKVKTLEGASQSPISANNDKSKQKNQSPLKQYEFIDHRNPTYTSAAAAAAASAANVPKHILQKPQTHYSPSLPINQRKRQPPVLNTPAETDQLPKEPQTPPQLKKSIPKTPEQVNADGANLLLHFAQSPGRSTPRTPDFNLNDYLHFQTPSPARNQLTPSQVRFGSLNSALFQK